MSPCMRSAIGSLSGLIHTNTERALAVQAPLDLSAISTTTMDITDTDTDTDTSYKTCLSYITPRCGH